MKEESKETVSDIVAEIRRDKDPYALKIATELDNASGDTVLNAAAATCLRDDCDYIKKLAGRIEAAARREVAVAKTATTTGDAARMREALEAVKLAAESTCGLRLTDDHRLRAIEKMCREALSAKGGAR